MDRKMLTAEEELTLFAQYRGNGDIRARNRLLLAHGPLVVRAVKNFVNRGTASVDDLRQEAFLGLARAIDKFDPSRGARLSTFAVFHIKQALTRYAMDQSGVVRIGTNSNDRKVFVHLRRMISEIEKRTSAPITDAGREEIAKKLGVSLGAVRRIESRIFEADICVEQVADGEIVVAELAVESVERKVDMSLDADSLMKRLTSVVEETYSGRDLMIAMEQIRGELDALRIVEVAARHGITADRVRQICAGVLLRLRVALERDGVGFDEISLS
jgi:RNA polymerase sigma-32 factor